MDEFVYRLNRAQNRIVVHLSDPWRAARYSLVLLGVASLVSLLATIPLKPSDLALIGLSPVALSLCPPRLRPAGYWGMVFALVMGVAITRMLFESTVGARYIPLAAMAVIAMAMVWHRRVQPHGPPQETGH